jgi:hypothetical protein
MHHKWLNEDGEVSLLLSVDGAWLAGSKCRNQAISLIEGVLSVIDSMTMSAPPLE